MFSNPDKRPKLLYVKVGSARNRATHALVGTPLAWSRRHFDTRSHKLLQSFEVQHCMIVETPRFDISRHSTCGLRQASVPLKGDSNNPADILELLFAGRRDKNPSKGIWERFNPKKDLACEEISI